MMRTILRTFLDPTNGTRVFVGVNTALVALSVILWASASADRTLVIATLATVVLCPLFLFPFLSTKPLDDTRRREAAPVHRVAQASPAHLENPDKLLPESLMGSTWHELAWLTPARIAAIAVAGIVIALPNVKFPVVEDIHQVIHNGDTYQYPQAPAAEQTPDEHDSLTFYDTLGGEELSTNDQSTLVPQGRARDVRPAGTRVAVALAPASAPSPSLTHDLSAWSVQVSVTRDPRTADSLLKRLRDKGYDAFVLKVRRRGETFYRVRVGHYGSLEDAQKVVSRLRHESDLPQAFVASD